MTHYRPQRGGFIESMALLQPVYSRRDLATILAVPVRSIGLKPYGYDERNDWDTYIVTVKNEAVGFTNGPLA